MRRLRFFCCETRKNGGMRSLLLLPTAHQSHPERERCWLQNVLFHPPPPLRSGSCSGNWCFLVAPRTDHRAHISLGILAKLTLHAFKTSVFHRVT